MEDVAMERSQRFWNPYLGGIALGLVLAASFIVSGRGLGASGAAYHVALAGLDAVAPAHVASVPYFNQGEQDHFENRLVFMMIGVLLGGLMGAYSAGRLKLGIVRGPRIGVWPRLALALAGGVIMGMSARMSLGCTSFQALSGGALLSVGSWVFMMGVFGGGYALAWFVRRQWT
jgi:hypothetical protein